MMQQNLSKSVKFHEKATKGDERQQKKTKQNKREQ
jgi:hypothetical protein